MIHSTALVHSHALVEEGARIGARTRVWAFAHVLKGAVIGEDCNICDHTFVEGKVVIGDRVTIKSGVYLWDGMKIGNDVFIGPAAAFTNDRRPRSRRWPEEFPPTLVHDGASIGANATILPNIVVGHYSMIGAGAVVTRHVPAHALVYGNPARVAAWVCECGATLDIQGGSACCQCGMNYRYCDGAVRALGKQK